MRDFFHVPGKHAMTRGIASCNMVRQLVFSRAATVQSRLNYSMRSAGSQISELAAIIRSSNDCAAKASVFSSSQALRLCTEMAKGTGPLFSNAFQSGLASADKIKLTNKVAGFLTGKSAVGSRMDEKILNGLLDLAFLGGASAGRIKAGRGTR